jgi:hypothetical protein
MGSGFSVWNLASCGMGVTRAAQIFDSKVAVPETRQESLWPSPPTLSDMNLSQGRGVIRMLLARYLMSVLDNPGGMVTRERSSLVEAGEMR